MRPLVDQYLAKRALDEHATYSGPPAFAPEEPAPVITTEAAKYLNERRDENRTDNRGAPSALPMMGAKEASDKPWEKEAPEGKKKSTLTDAQKDAARRRAAEAGRKYPNLIDNMWAAGRGSKKEAAGSAETALGASLLALGLGGVPAISGALAARDAPEREGVSDALLTGGGSAAGGLAGLVGGSRLGESLGRWLDPPSKGIRQGNKGFHFGGGFNGSMLGGLAGLGLGQLGGAALGHYFARRGDKKDDSLDLGESPAKTGSEDALILLGLPHDWAEKLAAGAWQRAEGKNPEGGLNAKGRASLKAEGHNIKPPVSSEQAKKSPKAAARRKSFCARMSGMPGPMKKDNGEPTRKALSLRKWDC